MPQVFRKSKIIQVAREIPTLTKQNYPFKIRDRALFSLLYLSGARIGEIVYLLKKKDFEFVRFQNKNFMVVELYTEKNRKHPIRRVPVNVEKERTLVNFVLQYIDSLTDDDSLFHFTKQRAWQIVGAILKNYKQKSRTNKFMNANHFLRHCRLTHLVTMHDFTDQDLVQFTGWSNSIPATTYSHLRFKDLARKMI